ncbi:MAG: diguanylate cyclase [Xanthobacteraceae bacterium]|nr:MAG: diguanylate cyclase [Xanthobacteraceae bacterium]
MPRASFRFAKYRAKLKALLSIRARLILIALILAVPLMLDRVRDLEQTRLNQIRTASNELVELARRGADTHRDVIAMVQALLTTAARIHAHGPREQGCALLQDSFLAAVDWIHNISIVGGDGRITCSTLPKAVGLDISDRPYFQQATSTGSFVLSDYIISRTRQQSSVMAVLPLGQAGDMQSGVMMAPVNLGWLMHLMAHAKVRPGVGLWLVDSAGVALADPSGADDRAARQFPDQLRQKILATDQGLESAPEADGRPALFAFVRVPGTQARLVVGIGEDKVLGAIDREIRNAYVQFGLVSLLILLGAWLLGERLLIRPIRLLSLAAHRFGRGDLKARVTGQGLPKEFEPLARAFNSMASQLADRERDLRASNNRLTVLASVDLVSGLANRRGFESRLDYEWMHAIETGEPLGLLMIDVDHFKQFNDTYGHPEGDVCLRHIGDALADIANSIPGFAARYGGEEFLLLLPNADERRAAAMAEQIRAAVERLGIAHTSTDDGCVTVSVGAAALLPTATSRVQDLIDAADAGLYAAKRRGRNQVVAHGVVETLAGPEMEVAAAMAPAA